VSEPANRQSGEEWSGTRRMKDAGKDRSGTETGTLTRDASSGNGRLADGLLVGWDRTWVDRMVGAAPPDRREADIG
jgi:hypothetical protein